MQPGGGLSVPLRRGAAPEPEFVFGRGSLGPDALALDPRLLRSFVVLAEELHFGRAAERLNVAQPALSQQIHRLEQQVGTPLYTRNSRLVELTDSGRAILDPARAALRAAELIDVWTVDSSRRAQLVQLILEILREVVTKRPGFMSARVYESTDGGAVMVSIDMRTIEKRHDLTDSREIQTAVRGLRAIAHSHVRLYRLVESFGEPGAA